MSDETNYRISCSSDEIIFRGHSKKAIKTTFKILIPGLFTIPPTRRKLLVSVLYGGRYDAISQYFELEGDTRNLGDWGEFAFLQSREPQINLTLKPQQNISVLPEHLSFYINDTDILKIPIAYNFVDHQPANAAGEKDVNLPGETGVCKQCNRRAQYSCDNCDPTYRLCLRCTQLRGREIHMTRAGEDHEMKLIPDFSTCSMCKETCTGNFNLCIPCDERAPDAAALCMNCFSTHQNIDKHISGTIHGHAFVVVDSDTNETFLGPREPQPFYHTRASRPTCSECKSKIGLEFLKCTTCIDSYNLCDRCADGGGIGKHRYHELEYMIPTIGNPPAAPTGVQTATVNPESTR